jgi:hypothetical protein
MRLGEDMRLVYLNDGAGPLRFPDALPFGVLTGGVRPDFWSFAATR